MSTSRLRIIVLGYLVRGPLGGIAWHHLQYMLGLARLGHDVFFFEDSDEYPSCYDPVRNAMGVDPTYGLAFAARAFERLGLKDRWTYYDAHLDGWYGPAADTAFELCDTADVLLNLSCVNPLRPWLEHIPVRALIDTDPVFTQTRHLTDPAARARAARHTAFFSFGENIGEHGCTIPIDGFPWRATRQPIVIDAWTASRGPVDGPVTTVMLWESYRAAEYDGIHFGMKGESFGPYLNLPARSGGRFEIALGSRHEPRTRLERHGWTVRDPREPTKDPWTYQEFIRRSKAEFSVAKHGYVVSHSGWFSERSAAYLASGRPVVIQDTGFSRWLSTDVGVLSFTNVDEACERLESLDREYDRHCDGARAIAEAYFDSDVILTRLLEQACEVREERHDAALESGRDRSRGLQPAAQSRS
jgi:hypothetical protein